MKPEGFSETSGPTYQATRYHSPEGLRENLTAPCTVPGQGVHPTASLQAQPVLGLRLLLPQLGSYSPGKRTHAHSHTQLSAVPAVARLYLD
jgi:hypothetical protein